MLDSQILSNFDQKTLQRSIDYLNQVVTDDSFFRVIKDNEYYIIQAHVKGNDTYETKIWLSTDEQIIADTECSCPVGYFCKHAAALAQVFIKSQSLPSKSASSEIDYSEAEIWLQQLQYTLQELPYNIDKQDTIKKKYSTFIYLLEQDDYQLKVEIFKARRSKSGEIKSKAQYDSYLNVISGKLSLSIEERILFTKIYTFSQTVTSYYYYQPYLSLNNIPIEILKELTDSGCLYDKNHQTKPLSWSDKAVSLSIKWQKTEKDKERLVINLQDATGKIYDVAQTTKYQLLFSQPLTYLNKNSQQIGKIVFDDINEIPSELFYELLHMPNIPKEFLPQVEDVFINHPQTAQLPPSNILKEIESLYGDPQPIIRFDDGDILKKHIKNDYQYWNDYVIPQEKVSAEICFAYEGGEVFANSKGDYFIGRKNGNRVRQHRNILAEKKAIKNLKKLIKSFKWIKSAHIRMQDNPHSQAMMNIHEVLPALVPIDKISEIGWQVEHLPNSPVKLEFGKTVELFINEDKLDNQWLEVGASITDTQGNRYDLLDIVASLLKTHPYLLEENIEAFLNPNHLFSVQVHEEQPKLAIAFKDILPILQNLKSILSTDSRKIDRYDAPQLIELEHTLGMAWQTSDRLKTFIDKLKQGYQSSLPTPAGFKGQLRPYQQQGLAWLQFLRDTEHGGILADDMGLGKTAQTLAHILLEKQSKRTAGQPILIVAPTSLMHNWQKEAEKFTPDLSVLLLHGANRHDNFDELSDYDIVLTTYPLIARDEEILTQHEFYQVILDEAQNIKNPNTKAAQTLRKIQTKHRLCLTGTPMENHLGELWSLFYFLMPGFLGSQKTFNQNYRHPIEKKNNKQARHKLLNRIKPFILRRLKTEVAKELPDKTTIEVNIDMFDEQSKLYEAVRATVQENIRKLIAEKGFNRSQIHILEAILKLRQVCCHPKLLHIEDNLHNTKLTKAKKSLGSAKLEHLMDMLTKMLEEGRKILIFSQFTSMLSLIEEQLTAHKMDYTKLTGQTRKRAEAIDAFQSGKVPIFLISLKAGGVGLNLTAADTVIHYDPWWNPAVEDQASDRAWRIGQDKPVFVYKLIMNQSIEEKIINLQKTKAELAQSILSIDHENESKLGEEEILSLLERF